MVLTGGHKCGGLVGERCLPADVNGVGFQAKPGASEAIFLLPFRGTEVIVQGSAGIYPS